MNKFLITLKLALISLLLTSFILLSILSVNVFQKEKTRNVMDNEVSVLFKNDQIKTKVLISEEKKKKLDLENLNSSIKNNTDKILEEKDFISLKEKRKIENVLKNRIIEKWKKPFNYQDGDGCFINLYFNRDNNYRYNINDCINENAIVKRSIEVALLDILEKENLSNIYKYKKNDKLKIFIY